MNEKKINIFFNDDDDENDFFTLTDSFECI